MRNKVAIIMGSDSDYPIMEEAVNFLKEMNVPFVVDVVSAHRTPEKMINFAQNAVEEGIAVIIAGAGGAAHLPGMVASITPLPVIGVPIKSRNSIDGWDSILSILQMPAGIPVATVALDGGRNAGILACSILASHDDEMLKKMTHFKAQLKLKVEQKAEKLKNKL